MSVPSSPPGPPQGPASASPPSGSAASRDKLRRVARELERRFLAREEVIRLLLATILAGEHLLLVGPPGTAKSALLRTLARLVDARYFEYLLTRFSEPNELLGPIDIRAFREGEFRRRTEHMLPEAELVFLDEIWKGSSAILNSLLTLLNERRVHIGAERREVPLLSLTAASNELPTDDSLVALLDRFLVRVRVDAAPGHQFRRLIELGLMHERQPLADDPELVPILSAGELRSLQRELRGRLSFSDEFLSTYKSLLFQIRAEGIALSDRRAVKLLKLCAASAFLDGRKEADASDLYVLKHTWNSPEQAEALESLVQPILLQHGTITPTTTTMAELLDELGRLRLRLASAAELSDLELFAHLRTLGELKTALLGHSGDAAERARAEIDALLDSTLDAQPGPR
jgi:MoxR-like ATPase